MRIRTIKRKIWMERIEISFKAYGHRNIKATHKSTLEFTKEDNVTEKGDCIIAIKSDYSANDLPDNLKNLLKNNDTKVIIELKIDNLKDTIYAYGSEKLTLKSNISIVIRKSNYIDDRTIAIKSDKAAININRKIIKHLKNPSNSITVKIIAYRE